MIVSCPGKVMLLGDYGVLAGGRALVAAVNRRAVGRRVERGRASPVIDAVLARADRRGLELEIDTGSFYEGELKLGLGSSAAVAVLTAALASDTIDDRTLQLAIDGHRDANDGKGSCVDVASCFHGGVIATSRQPAEVVQLAHSLDALHFSVLFTEKSASTKDLVGACMKSRGWPEWSRVLVDLTEEGLGAWSRQDASHFLDVVAQYARAMAKLGESAGVAIMTEELDAIFRYAGEAGGAAKPSGAGGGDIAVLWSADPELGAKIAERAGVRLLDLAVEPRGVRRESAASA